MTDKATPKTGAKRAPAKKKTVAKKPRATRKPTQKKTSRGWGQKIWSISWKLGLVLAVIIASYAIYLDQIIARKFEGQKWHLPAQVFSRSMALYPGAAVSH
ncbi:penicillin-binding protein 1B, partial [Shewanella sp. 0m-11]